MELARRELPLQGLQPARHPLGDSDQSQFGRGGGHAPGVLTPLAPPAPEPVALARWQELPLKIGKTHLKDHDDPSRRQYAAVHVISYFGR